MTKYDDDLKPCPFCGGRAEPIVKHKGAEFQAWVRCFNCNARTGARLARSAESWWAIRNESKEAWNRRAGEKEDEDEPD